MPADLRPRSMARHRSIRHSRSRQTAEHDRRGHSPSGIRSRPVAVANSVQVGRIEPVRVQATPGCPGFRGAGTCGSWPGGRWAWQARGRAVVHCLGIGKSNMM